MLEFCADEVGAGGFGAVDGVIVVSREYLERTRLW